MRALPTKIWQKFQFAVGALSDQAPRREILKLVLFWIRENYKYLAVEPFSTYGFDEISRIDEEVMPIDYSSFMASDVINF